MKLNTIHCGECAETMRDHIPDNSIDLTITSPPYDNLRDYKGYTFDFEKIASELWRVTKPGGVVVWIVGDATVDGSETGTSFRQALRFMELGFKLHDTMIWNKGGFTAVGTLKARYASVFEFMFIFSKGTISTFNPIIDRINKNKDGRFSKVKRVSSGEMKDSGKFANRRRMGQRFNVWEIGAHVQSGGNCHPAIFPEALARDHIISWSNPGDIVLDPMCGSGTTLKMAVEQGRRYIGIDISQEYVDLSQKRVEGARVPLPMINETPTQDREQLGFK